jgi:hypothetical protein
MPGTFRLVLGTGAGDNWPTEPYRSDGARSARVAHVGAVVGPLNRVGYRCRGKARTSSPR